MDIFSDILEGFESMGYPGPYQSVRESTGLKACIASSQPKYFGPNSYKYSGVIFSIARNEISCPRTENYWVKLKPNEK